MATKAEKKLEEINDLSRPASLADDAEKYRPWSEDTSIKVAENVVAFVHKDTGQVLLYKV